MDQFSLSGIVTIQPTEAKQPAQIIAQYPLSVTELRRLAQFQTFLCARVWLHDQGLNCSKRAAKRLAFGRYLAMSRRISEATS